MISCWHAFRSHIKCELRAQDGIKELGFDVFVPLESRWIIRRRRKLKVESPLFTGYGFVKFDIIENEWPKINNVDGVEGLLSNNRVPVRVPEREIDQLKLAQKFGLFDRTKKPSPFKLGDKVQIEEGPFSGFIGKVIKARTADRINILLNFFGSTREVEFPLLQVRANQI